MEKDGVDLLEEGGYVDITVNQVEQTYFKNETTGIEQRDRNKTEIEYEKWGDKFYSTDTKIMENLNIK